MKRLLILTVLAGLTVSSASGCRLWNNWIHRGDVCDVEMDSCNSGPILGGAIPSGSIPSTMGPTNSHRLPGPIEQIN